MILLLVHLDVLIAPEPDKISRKKCTPTVPLLFSSGYVSIRFNLCSESLFGGSCHCPGPVYCSVRSNDVPVRPMFQFALFSGTVSV